MSNREYIMIDFLLVIVLPIVFICLLILIPPFIMNIRCVQLFGWHFSKISFNGTFKDYKSMCIIVYMYIKSKFLLLFKKYKYKRNDVVYYDDNADTILDVVYYDGLVRYVFDDDNTQEEELSYVITDEFRKKQVKNILKW